MIAIIAIWILSCSIPMGLNRASADDSPEPNEFTSIVGSFYQNSLHFTTEGMRACYEADDGFMQLTGIPYKDLGCKSCHAKNCDSCHAQETDSGMIFSIAKAKDMDTCLPCHSRENKSISMDKAAGTPDVHFDMGFECSTCHTAREIHGTGTLPTSMREPGYMETSCEGCHSEDGIASPVDKTKKAHNVHKGKLDCAACHVSNTMACYNCHFSRFLETKTKAGNFIATKDWMFLINYDGKVTSGTLMTLVHEDKTFAGFGPYFTHSIMKKGHACSDCHANKAVMMMKEGKKVPIAKFEGDNLVFWQGIIPTVAENIDFLFLDKQDDKWFELRDGQDPLIQYFCYGSPLTEDQMKKLYMPFK